MHVSIYRSSVKDGLYAYLGNDTTLEDLPAPVMKQLGTPELAMEFDLTKERTLPNAETSDVLEAIEKQGFYVQMPKDIEAILARVSDESVSQQK